MGLLQCFIFFCSIYALYAASVDYKSYKGYRMYSVEGKYENIVATVNCMKELDDICNLRGVDAVQAFEVPVDMPFVEPQNELYFSGNRTAADILIAPDLIPVFESVVKSYDLKATLLSDDYSQIIRIEKARPLRGSETFSWTAYYDVKDIHRYLKNVSLTYPESTELIVGGKSYEGRRILGLRINTPTNRMDEKDKPVMFIESGIHAREWITPATTTYFINQLLTSSDPEIADMRDQFDWRIFPTVNPDGYHYSFNYDRMWRKTRSVSPNGCRGADPNRNWDYNWLKHGASSNPCDYQTFGGASPFSEVETRSLSEYLMGIENLLGYVAFHADAQMLLVPYSDSVEHIDNYDDLIQIGKTSLDYGYKVNGEKYDGPATAAEILYKASGGSMDWVRNALGTQLVYTYELRGRYFYWPPSRIPEQGDEVTQMMLGFVNQARDLGYF